MAIKFHRGDLAITSAIAFVLVELRAKEPILPMSLFLAELPLADKIEPDTSD